MSESRPTEGTSRDPVADDPVAAIPGLDDLRDPTPQGVWRWLMGAVTVAVIALVASAGLVAMSDDADRPSTASDTGAGPVEPRSDDVPPPPRTRRTTTTQATTTTTVPRLQDGRHAAYLTAVSPDRRRLELDFVRFHRGDAAVMAYRAEHPDAPGGPPDGYWIVNEKPVLRTMPVAEDVAVTVVRRDLERVDRYPIGFADLASYVAASPLPDDERLWPWPFWLTVRNGTVVAVDEIDVP